MIPSLLSIGACIRGSHQENKQGNKKRFQFYFSETAPRERAV